jgi:hypothetical protein
MNHQQWQRPYNSLYSYPNEVIHRRISRMISKLSNSSISNVTLIVTFTFYSYVTRIDENSPAGTTLVFPEPYITRVSDDDAGKNGVFSLTLLNNNGTFEIFPNVAERKANFIIRVRDNNMLNFEEYTSLSFQVSILLLM